VAAFSHCAFVAANAEWLNAIGTTSVTRDYRLVGPFVSLLNLVRFRTEFVSRGALKSGVAKFT
jgi:hypothetical protein